MKWFKMQSDNLDDSFIQDLFSEFGATGYMVYFGIISLICKENKNKLTGKAEFSSSFLKQKLHVSPRKLQEIIGFCEVKDKLLYSFSNKKFNLDFPKMLEIKDNYTKDLQVTMKNVSNHKEVEVDTKDKEDKEKVNTKEKPGVCVKTLKINFEEDWAEYPKKKGANKTKSFDCYKRTVGIEKRLEFNTKTQAYIDSFDNGDLEYCKNADTWFRNWEGIEVSKDEKTKPKRWYEELEDENNATL